MTTTTHRRCLDQSHTHQIKDEKYAGQVQAPPAAANDGSDSNDSNDSAGKERRRIADEQLVGSAQAGEIAAFEQLVDKYRNKVVQLVGRLVGEADAQDVAQETFIKAYRAIGGFRGQSAFYTWLYRVAINSAKNHLVARHRRPASQDIDVTEAEMFGHTDHLSDVDTPESILLAEEMEQNLAGVIQQLPADLRQAIMLRELDGLTYDEIAEVMECPIGTVRSRIFRARESIDSVVGSLQES